MRIAAIQDSPVFLDRSATLNIVQKRIAEAGEGGADLIAFPEVFVSGYPVSVSYTHLRAHET